MKILPQPSIFLVRHRQRGSEWLPPGGLFELLLALAGDQEHGLAVRDLGSQEGEAGRAILA